MNKHDKDFVEGMVMTDVLLNDGQKTKEFIDDTSSGLGYLLIFMIVVGCMMSLKDFVFFTLPTYSLLIILSEILLFGLCFFINKSVHTKNTFIVILLTLLKIIFLTITLFTSILITSSIVKIFFDVSNFGIISSFISLMIIGGISLLITKIIKQFI